MSINQFDLLNRLENFNNQNEDYLKVIIEKLSLLGLINISEDKICHTQEACVYLKESLPNQAMILYRQLIHDMMRSPESILESNEKNYREVEKSLRRISQTSWVFLDDFLYGMTSSIGKSEAPTLKKIKKKWQYAIPQYSHDEKKFIEKMICETLFYSGMTAIGTYEGKRCFSLTPFGKIAIGV